MQYNLLLSSNRSIISSKNQIYNIENQSAGNQPNNLVVGSSETIRMLSKKDSEWLAGIIDGNGNFDFRNNTLKSIRIVMNHRDINVLYKIKNILKCGSIRLKQKNVFIYQICNFKDMFFCINSINGNIRLKVPKFKDSCKFLNIEYIEASSIVPYYSNYLAGLIDTDGSIVLNYPNNRIEVNIEFKYNEWSSKLDLSKVLPIPCSKIQLIKKNQNKEKKFYSIRFSYNTVNSMLPIYQYIKLNRLYSQFKFFRAMQIKEFLEIRYFKDKPKDSIEYKRYKNFLIKFLTYMNENKPLPEYLKKV